MADSHSTIHTTCSPVFCYTKCVVLQLHLCNKLSRFSLHKTYELKIICARIHCTAAPFIQYCLHIMCNKCTTSSRRESDNKEQPTHKHNNHDTFPMFFPKLSCLSPTTANLCNKMYNSIHLLPPHQYQTSACRHAQIH